MMTASPEAAPLPAIPTKLTLPMLLAKRDMPTAHHDMDLPARKKSLMFVFALTMV